MNKNVIDTKASSLTNLQIGSDFAIKDLDWDENLRIKLQLWDIAGISTSNKYYHFKFPMEFHNVKCNFHRSCFEQEQLTNIT